MAKFAINRFPAGFFDLTQDIAHRLPVDLIEHWTRSDHSPEAALALLSPHLVLGTVVSTDSAGLTSLTKLRGLVEILAMVNGPKEIVHACGKAVGGEPIGIWAADNTQMFYPFTWTEGAKTDPELLLSMLLETMHRVEEACEVRIGACIHIGSFFRLGGGLYGREADRVEHFAEEFSGAGEILLTNEFLNVLGQGHPFQIEERPDQNPDLRVWKVTAGPRLPELAALDFKYPYPYTQEFHQELRGLSKPVKASDVKAIHKRYTLTRTVVVMEREKEEMDVPEVAVLNDLSLQAAMTRIAVDVLRQTGGTEIKTIGNLGIYTFDAPTPALEFCRRLRGMFREQGVAVRSGIAQGEVFVFELGEGVVDIAGMPVNVASKLAQDFGQFGGIYLTQECSASVNRSGLEPYATTISRVALEGWSDGG
jgi:hypothetical protein